jgi:SAM-dependent methyltransferase
MPSTFNARDAEAYERVMGRWSRKLAGPFLDFAGDFTGRHVLDVGCGTGSLTFLLTGRTTVASIAAIDIAENYVAFARSCNTDPRIAFHCADAIDLPFEPDRFDASLSLLALHPIASAVWDVRGGLPHARMFLDTAAMTDPGALAMRERYMRVPLAQAGELAQLWQAFGLRDVTQSMISIRFDYEDFDDYWQPFLTGEGTMGGYVASLAPDARESLGNHLRAAYQAGLADGPRSFCATAWVCRGIVAKPSIPTRQ